MTQVNLPVRSGEMNNFISVEEKISDSSSFQAKEKPTTTTTPPPKNKNTKQHKKPNTFWSRGVLLSGSVDLNIRAFKQERNKLW